MDDDLLRRGQDVFDDWALDLTTALFCASLPHAYASGRGAAVLASVSELADGRRVEKRISLTGQMLLDITTPGALAVGAVGYRTVRRVRLLHACVRALLLLGDAAGNPWPTQARGLPINQQDMLGTQLAFTIAAFDGIMRLGYRMSKADKRAYLHLWSVVGHYLGITEAGRLRRSHGGEAAHAAARGVAAGDLAVGQGARCRRSSTTCPRGCPRPLRSLPAALVRRLAGHEVADLLDVPHSRLAPAVAVPSASSGSSPRATIGRWTLRLPSRLLGRALIGRSIAEGTGAADPAHLWPDQWLELERS